MHAGGESRKSNGKTHTPANIRIYPEIWARGDIVSIIIKFILKNIGEKKFRTFLILFSIVISTALFFSSRAASDKMLKLTLDRMKQSLGNADIIIQQGEKSPSPYFILDKAEKYTSLAEYIIGVIQETGFYKADKNQIDKINLYGADIGELNRMNPFSLVKEQNLYPFDGKKAVISQRTAEKYSLSIGDTFDLDINDEKHRFFICGISYPSGIFLEDGDISYALLPKETLRSLFGASGRESMAYIKLINPADKDWLIDKLSQDYKKYLVKEPFTMEEVRQQTGGMSTSFGMMTVLVFCMSVFIIYSSFKVITIERLPIIGTFRSIGATRKMTDMVLLAESILYGVVGGILGCGLGVLILGLLLSMTTPEWARGVNQGGAFSLSHLITSFAAAVVLSVISSILPIIRVARIPVKDIVLNKIDSNTRHSSKRVVFGFALEAIAIIAPGIAPGNIAIIIDMLSMVLSITAVIMLIPFLTKSFVKVFEKLYTLIFGNIGILAAKNLRDNHSILNNISLLAIGISGMLVINTVSYSVVSSIADTYKTRFDDIMLADPKADKYFERSILSVDGVKSVYSFYEDHNVEVAGTNVRIRAIQGADRNKFPEYRSLDMEEDLKTVLEELDAGRNIVVTNMLGERLNLKKGDHITLKMGRGVRNYKVIGFCNTMLFSGSYGLVSARYLKMDMDTQYFYRIYVKVNKDTQEVAENLEKRFSRRKPEITIVAEQRANNLASYATLFSILNGFSIMTMVIGIFGVLNNLIISFIERRRSFAIFRSIGMSKQQIIKMIFIEALTGGSIGGAVGVTTGFLLISVMPYVFRAVSQPVSITFDLNMVYSAFTAGVIITLVASISPALRTSRLNIIQSIKYE
jgi:putative ABC transport system permease protein